MTLDEKGGTFSRRDFLKTAGAAAALSQLPAFAALTASKDTTRRKDLMPYEDAEINGFRKQYLRVLDETLFKERHSMPMINDRFKALKTAINKKYGQYPTMDYTNAYYFVAKTGITSEKIVKYGVPKDIIIVPGVSAGNTVEKGVPRVYIIVPAYLDFIASAKKAKVSALLIQEVVGNSLVIDVMHELDHLAYDSPFTSKTTPEEFNRAEARAWAETCQNTIRHFVRAKSPIPDDHLAIYTKWNVTGSIMRREWQDFISEKYAKKNRAVMDSRK